MKKVMTSFISLAIVAGICFGIFKMHPYNDSPYTVETAVKRGDVVNVHGKQYNAEKLEKFIDNVKSGKKDKIRITTYTIEGDAITTDLEYTGKKIIYVFDNSRDHFGSPIKVKKDFISDSIYKDGSKYYLRNSSEDILIYW